MTIKPAAVHFLLALSLAFSLPLKAQLSEADTGRWQFRLAATGMLIQGNVERFLVTGRGELRHVEKNWGLFSGNTYLRGSIFGNRTEDDIISRNFLYLFPRRRWYPYQMTWLERNWRRRIDFRYQVGLGGTFAAVQRPRHLLKLSLTGTFEHTRFRGEEYEAPFADLTGNSIDTWRATARVFGRHQLNARNLQLRYECWVQPSLTDLENVRYHVESALSLPVAGRLSVLTEVNYTYERIVLRGIKRGDLIWSFGLAFANN